MVVPPALHLPLHEGTDMTMGEALVALGIWMERFSVGRNAMEVLLPLIERFISNKSIRFPTSMHLFNSVMGLHNASFSDYIVMFCPVPGCTHTFEHVGRKQWPTSLHETCPYHPSKGFRFVQDGTEANPMPSWGALYPPPEKYLQAQFSNKETVEEMERFHDTFIRSLRLPSAKPQGELMDWYDSSHAQRTAQALVMQDPILATQLFQPATHFVRLAGDDVSPDVKKV